jgi:serine/threonine protein kinase/Tol biopolymer transport system component
VGRELGAYHILNLIGAGGMGEVYLAVDIRLDRRIALKFLPAAVASNPTALRRLQQEARTASALNHPNILTIYEVGERDGEFFIASEYIDGITLRTALHSRSVDFRTAVDVATQVASALKAAHSAGVIHRDLKPANIMIRPDGYVKVIDFGLAKLTQQPQQEVPSQETWTRPGSVMGTLDYMSPEQIRGEKLDERTDLWSLGVVLYEMVAHKRPFGGDTESHVVVGILDSPVPPIQNAPGFPQPVIDIIDRALAKNRSKRYQTAQEMLTDLQQLRDGSAVGRSAAPTARPKPVRIPPLGVATGIIVVVFLASSVWWWGFHGKDMVLGPTWFQFESAKRITFEGNVRLATISPDGKYVAYVSGNGGNEVLRLRGLQTGSERQLPGTSDQYIGLTVSPDSKSLYYVLKNEREFGRLFATTIDGFDSTLSSMILEDIDGPVTFSPDGRRFAFLRRWEERNKTRDSIVIADETNPRNGRTLVRLTSTQIQDQLAWSPRDDWITAVVFPAGLARATQPTVSLFSLDGRQKRQFSPADLRGLALPLALDGGSLLLFAGLPRGAQQRHLVQLFIPTGEFHEVPSDILGFDSISATTDSSILAAVRRYQRSSIWSAGAADLNAARKLMPDIENIISFTWSDDGSIVFPSARSGNVNLSRLDQSGGVQPVGKAETCVEFQPSAVPSQPLVVYASNCAHGGDDFNLWTINLRTGRRLQLTNGSNYDYDPDVSPDGKWVAFTSWPSNVDSVWKIPTSGGMPVRLSPEQAHHPFFSPDGKHIVCQIREVGAPWRVAILSAEDGAIEQQLPRMPVTGAARWSPDGTALDYVDTQNGVSNIWRKPLAGGVPKQLTHLSEDDIISFAWSRDGTKLAYVRGRAESDVVLFHRGARH